MSLGHAALLPAWCAGVAVAVRLGAGLRYAWGVTRGRADPNPWTWLLWGLTGLTALGAQLGAGGATVESAVLLAQGATPLLVVALALRREGWAGARRWATPFTLTCVGLAVAGVVAWRLTREPVVAVWLAVAADLLAATPTLHKAWRVPGSEYPLPFLLNAAAMAVTVATVGTWTVATVAFPLYLLTGNLALFLLAARRRREAAGVYIEGPG